VDPSFPAIPLGALAAAAGGDVVGDPNVVVRGAAFDDHDVEPGGLFFCVQGTTTDGHDLAARAVAAGAAALVVERRVSVDVSQIVVRSVRQAMGPMSRLVFGDPAATMTTVAFTGTNGKTTSTYLLEAVFRAAGLTPGVIGTTGARIDGRSIPLARTTPEAPELHRVLSRMRGAGVRAVALEASSHALAFHRLDGIVFDASVFTNLSHDHLDFHPTMEAYFAAKATLFDPAHSARGIVNADDAWARKLAEDPTIELRTFAVERDADVRARDVRLDADGLSFRVSDVTVRSPLRGAFNVWNVLGVLAVAETIGLDLGRAAEAIEDVRGVPGRMEPVDAGQEFLVVVDYAHTPDSILSVLRGARPLTAGRLICVFGCGGDRDRAKRSPMGEVSTSNADLTVITSDNPRTEDPLAIIEEVVTGAAAGGGAYVVEPDRRAAIRFAVGQARPGDVVIIAGKGHESSQEVAGALVPFDDRAVAHEELARLGDRA
jgi:UDP-N-acetylmuramoyl-L-alanyl-D-glutamate--2,6-diaminopimelate ligase